MMNHITFYQFCSAVRRKGALALCLACRPLGLGLSAAWQGPPSAKADSEMYPNVIPPDSVAYGRTDGEWHAAWWQWTLSIPSTQHPMFDTGDCSVGQTGPVWFLGGSSATPLSSALSLAWFARVACLPGRRLYVQVVGDEDSALEESTAENPGNETYQLINTLRSVDAAFADATTSVFLSVDGVPVPDLMQRFRGQSTVFGFTLPPAAQRFLHRIWHAGQLWRRGATFPRRTMDVCDGRPAASRESCPALWCR